MLGNKRMMGIGFGLLGGLIAGAAVGLMYAPKRGEETRKLVKDKAMELRNRAMDTASLVATKATQAMQQIQGNTPSQPGSMAGTAGDAVIENRELPVSRPMEIPTEEAAHPGPRASQQASQQASRRARNNALRRVTVNTTMTPRVAPEKNVGGNTVIDNTGKKIGKLEGVMLDTENGQIIYGVIAMGDGGMEEKLCAYPWPAFRETGNERYTLDIAPEKMERMVTFTRQNMPSQTALDDIDAMYDYYGYTHYWQKKRTGTSVPVENLD